MSIRVLIVDDSPFFLELLTEALSDPDFRVIGTARDGREALEKVVALKPDVITLDVEMPGLDGLATLTELRNANLRIPVIMCSALTERAAAITIDCLLRGACDYVTKPSAGGVDAMRTELRSKIRASIEARKLPATPSRPRPLSVASELTPRIVAIGLSTGGPAALTQIFKGLPAELPAPVVVVQHMLPMFTRVLAQRLSTVAKMPVVEVEQEQPLEAGKAYVAPGNFHLTFAQDRDAVVAKLGLEPPVNSCRPSVDVLFESIAEVYGPRALAVVMTGMGRDGLAGAERIFRSGGTVWAQDEASSVVWGMPGLVVEAGVASRVLPLVEIAPEIAKRFVRSALPAGVAVKR